MITNFSRGFSIFPYWHCRDGKLFLSFLAELLWTYANVSQPWSISFTALMDSFRHLRVSSRAPLDIPYFASNYHRTNTLMDDTNWRLNSMSSVFTLFYVFSKQGAQAVCFERFLKGFRVVCWNACSRLLQACRIPRESDVWLKLRGVECEPAAFWTTKQILRNSINDVDSCTGTCVFVCVTRILCKEISTSPVSVLV